MQAIDTKASLDLDQTTSELPAYAPPVVTTYTDEQLLEALGPAQAQPYGRGKAGALARYSK